jgi:hypothetical protein
MSNSIALEEQRQLLEMKSLCNRLLRTAGVDGVCPTPIDQIVEAAELLKSKDLALLEIPREPFPSIWKKFKGSLVDLVSRVKAGLFPQERTIFINPKTHVASVPFATLHECCHYIFPWQRKTYAYLDDERTLDPQTRFIFERQANVGASYLLWQGEAYVKDALDMPITAATPVSLAQRYGGSVHSSMRYYVEHHRESLLLMVVKRHRDAAALLDRYKLQYMISSPAFTTKFGHGRLTVTLSDDHVLLKRSNPIVTFWEGEIGVRVGGSAQPFLFFGYETPYNIFIILAPKKVVRSYGTAKVILTA